MRTYSDLITDVRGFLNRKDLDEQIPRFIMLAEQDLFRRLRANCNEATVIYTPKATGYPNHAAIRLPDECLELKSVLFDGMPLQYVSDAEYYKRLHREPAQMVKIPEDADAGWPLPPDVIDMPRNGPIELDDQYGGVINTWREAWPPHLAPPAGYFPQGTGKPAVFTRINNYLCFHPISEKLDTVVNINMYAFDGPLDSVNYQTNTLQDAYSAYLYGALSHAEGFLMNDPRIALWKSKFEETLGQLNGTKTDADLGSVQEVMSAYG
jgi:hypothetical protein